MTLFEVSKEAQSDLFEIWSRIASDDLDLADRVDGEFYRLFASLARMPRQGHRRLDLTARPVLFMPMYSFLVIYAPDSSPLRIVAVLRGKRNVRRILRERVPR